MILALVFVFLLPIVAINADSYTGSCKCYPTKMTGKVDLDKVTDVTNSLYSQPFTFYVDYTKNKVVEDRKDGTKVVYDMTNMLRYTFDSSGCRKASVPRMKGYVQCVPDNANYKAETTSNGERLTSFQYPENNYFLKRWVLEDNNCLLYRARDWTIEGTTKHDDYDLSMQPASASVEFDDAIFDVDTSGCK